MRRRADRTRARRYGSLAVALLGLGISAAVVLPYRRPATDPARLERAAHDLRVLACAFNAYCVDTGSWPLAAPGDTRARTSRELVEIGCLVSNLHGLAGWKGPYVERNNARAAGSLIDPWGRPYLAFYLPGAPGAGLGEIRLLSTGPDRRLDSALTGPRAVQVAADDLSIVVTRLL